MPFSSLRKLTSNAPEQRIRRARRRHHPTASATNALLRCTCACQSARPGSAARKSRRGGGEHAHEKNPRGLESAGIPILPGWLDRRKKSAVTNATIVTNSLLL